MPRKQSTIQNFIASMNRSGGFARTSKYAVIITPPASLSRLAAARNSTVIAEGTPFQRSIDGGFADTNAANMQTLNSQVGRQVNLHCNTVSMPGHDLQAQDQQHGSAPGRQMVQSHDYAGTIAASFYLDVHMRERHFFEQWQKMAVNTNTHKANYYDDYIGTMEIFQLDGNGEITYGIKATEVYPATIAGIEYAYENTNQIATQAVKFQYRQWFNLTADSIAGYNDISRFAVQDTKTYGPPDIESSGTSLFSNAKAEQKRQEQLRSPEIDRQLAVQNIRQREAKRQEQLRSPEVKTSDPFHQTQKEFDREQRLKKPNVDADQQQLAVKKEQDRQRQLRTPEIDRQDNSRRSSIKELKRQEQLRSPTSN